MNKWNVDKIIVVGLIAVLIVSIVASFWTGNGVELQATIAGGLVGYISRSIHDRNDDNHKRD